MSKSTNNDTKYVKKHVFSSYICLLAVNFVHLHSSIFHFPLVYDKGSPGKGNKRRYG